MQTQEITTRSVDSAAAARINTPRVEPRANIAEGSENYRLELLVPGTQKDTFTISLDKDILTINAPSDVSAPEGLRAFAREFGPVVFKRRFRLPADVDREAVQAKLEAGVLTLTLPKREAAKPRTVAIS